MCTRVECNPDWCQSNTIKNTKKELILDDVMYIPKKLYTKLNRLGLISNEIRKSNVGESNYSKHIIQPWSIWQDWNLNPWDADIIKRVLRTKSTDTRIMDYEKIIHICQERIRQLKEDIL